MARLKKNSEKVEKEIIDESVETETTKEVVKKETKPKTEKTKKPKTKQQLSMELSKVSEDIFVELLNASTGKVIYMNKFGDAYVDLDPTETVVLNLKQVQEISTKAKGFFSGGSLILTTICDCEYSINEILNFLRLDKLQIEDYDYLEELIIESDDDYFKSVLKNKNKKFVKKVAAKAVYLNGSDEVDYELSRRKEEILSDLLGVERLIY